MIDGLTNSSAIPVLERMLQFAGQRHQLIANNIANLSTPGFRPADVSVEGFQAQLREAVDARREARGGTSGDFVPASTHEVQFTHQGLSLNPTPRGDNILFHDGNDRDVERTMQSLVENFMTYRAAAQLLRNRFEAVSTAIRERM